jgi:beta-phosphoglucomutase
MMQSDLIIGDCLPSAVIFDMDGVLVDSNPFHLEKWAEFLTRHRIKFNPDELPRLILGQHNDTALRHFFGETLSAEDSNRLAEELEETFRKTFKAHARPMAGLEEFVRSCKAAGIPVAVASSAMMKNVEFVIDALGFRQYIDYCVSGDDVTHPKPDPEIYLKAARDLGFKPETCVAFEDSFVGIEAAKGAGLKCVAIASTFPLAQLQTQTHADLAVHSFEELTLDRVRELFEEPEARS